MTVSADLARDLLDWTEPDEERGAWQGFARSESRLTGFGRCWRRHEPHQASSDLGSNYESWEWDGSTAMGAADWIAGRAGCRPSRVDVAFDIDCEEWFRPEDLEVVYAAHASARGCKLGIAGEGGVNTLYVGSRQKSDRCVRVYRKDLQSPAFAFVGPTLRVELVMRRKRAHSWWPLFSEDQEIGYAAAAGWVEEMIGLRVQEFTHEVPPLVAPECADDAENLFQFIVQHGERVRTWHESGVPFFGLIDEVCALLNSRSRSDRAKKRKRHWASVDVGQVVELVRKRSQMSIVRASP